MQNVILSYNNHKINEETFTTKWIFISDSLDFFFSTLNWHSFCSFGLCRGYLPFLVSFSLFFFATATIIDFFSFFLSHPSLPLQLLVSYAKLMRKFNGYLSPFLLSFLWLCKCGWLRVKKFKLILNPLYSSITHFLLYRVFFFLVFFPFFDQFRSKIFSSLSNQ